MSTDPTGKTPIISTSSQQFIIALVILLVATLLLWTLAFVAIPDKNQTVLNVVVGNIMGFVGATIAFYFPSSVGARAKDEAIATMAAQISSTPPTTTTTTVTTKKDDMVEEAPPKPVPVQETKDTP